MQLIPAELAQREPLSDIDDDLRATERQFEQNPTRRMLLHFLAVEYYKRNYTKRCMHVCRLLTSLETTRASVWQLLARCQLRLRLDDEAKETLQLLLKMPGIDDEVTSWARQRYDELTPQLPTTAPDENEQGLKKGSPLGGLLEQRDIVTYIGAKSDDQIAAVKAQVDADPDNPDLLDWYAFVLYSSDFVEESIEIYERIVKEFTPSDAAYYYLGSAYLKMGKVKMAYVYFESLKRDFPKSPLSGKIEDKMAKLKGLSKK